MTDHDPRQEGYVMIDGQKFEVVGEEDASNAEVERRYIVAPAPLS